ISFPVAIFFWHNVTAPNPRMEPAMKHFRRFALVSISVLAYFGRSASADDAQIKDVLAKIGPGKGIVVLVGAAGDLAPDLAKQSEWTFFVQQPKAQADKLRRVLDQAGLIGNRVYV